MSFLSKLFGKSDDKNADGKLAKQATHVKENTTTVNKTQDATKLYSIDRPEESRAYIQGWSITGKRLNTLFEKYGHTDDDPHASFLWLRTKIISPTFDSMNFSYKNQVFSVLVDLIDASGRSTTSTKAKELQVLVAEQNNLIPCLFKVQLTDMQPATKTWNLFDTRTGEPVIPQWIATDEKIEMSKWELQNWGITIVMDDLEKMGNKILSFTDAPEIFPQLWFEDESGNRCWVVVTTQAGLSGEEQDFSHLSRGKLAEFKGFTAHVSFIPNDGEDKMYRSHPAMIKYEGIKSIGVK